MKIFARSLLLAAAMSVATAPAMAAPARANPAAPLSVAKAARAATPAHREARLAGGLSTSTVALGIVGAIVILAVVLIATNDTPTSVA